MWERLTILCTASLAWIVRVVKRDLSIVDSVRALMFVISGSVYAMTLPETGLVNALAGSCRPRSD